MLLIHKLVAVLGCLAGHENRITSLSVAANGMAVATCSWDQNVRVWVWMRALLPTQLPIGWPWSPWPHPKPVQNIFSNICLSMAVISVMCSNFHPTSHNHLESWGQFSVHSLLHGDAAGNSLHLLLPSTALNCELIDYSLTVATWQQQTNSMVWVRERTIPTEQPPLVGEVIASLCG
jgi:WD40 repeat protein